MSCPECAGDEAVVATEMVNEEIHYGQGDDSAVITANVPLRKCGSCGFQWVDQEGQKIRDKAVKDYLEQKESGQ